MYQFICGLLFPLAILARLRADQIWCYCTMCIGDLPYCKTYNGMCYKDNINDTFTSYGCLGPELINDTCSLGYTMNQDNEGYFYYRQITCCNETAWCNANSEILDKIHNRLPDIQRENSYDKQSCYCNICSNNKTCFTNGHCYRDLTAYASPIYGCLDDFSTCGTIGHRQLGIDYYDPPLQCCSKEKWCNFDVQRIREYDTLSVHSEIKIRWIKLENMGYFASRCHYRLIAHNIIGGKILLAVKKISHSGGELIVANITDGNFDFGVEYNALYEFQLIPYIGNYLTESMMVFYFATLLRANVTWFQDTSIYYNTSIRTLVICGRCISSAESFRCLLCTSYYDPDLNPIQLPEWSLH